MSKFTRRLSIIAIIIIICSIVLSRFNIEDIFNSIKVRNVEVNVEGYINKLRDAMLEGETEFSIKYVGNFDGESVREFVENSIDYALDIDDPNNSCDYDYLRNKYRKMNASIKGLGSAYKITYILEYNENMEETEEVDRKVKELLNDMKVTMLPKYDRIKKIHDFIVENAEYDKSLTRYSTYDNLINKSSVCQGYAGLTYKMMTEAGIPCRIITGTSMNELHAWNIVEIKDVWYNIDCTWDDPLYSDGSQGVSYDYFLKSDKDFINHIRDGQYTTDEFYETYKMSESSYDRQIR